MIEFVNRTLAGDKPIIGNCLNKRRFSERTFDEALESFVLGMQEQRIDTVWSQLLTQSFDDEYAEKTENEQFVYMVRSATLLLNQCERLYFKQEDLDNFQKNLRFLFNDLLTLHYIALASTQLQAR